MTNLWTPFGIATAVVAVGSVVLLSGYTGCASSNEKKTTTGTAAAVAAPIAAVHRSPTVSPPTGAQVEEYKENGRAIGFRLQHIEPDSAWAHRGLRDGDVVLGVNGDTVSTAEGAGTLWSRVQSGEGASFEILRPDVKTGKLARRTLGPK